MRSLDIYLSSLTIEEYEKIKHKISTKLHKKSKVDNDNSYKGKKVAQ